MNMSGPLIHLLSLAFLSALITRPYYCHLPSLLFHKWLLVHSHFCSFILFIYLLFFQERPPYQVEKKEGNECARGWCVRRGSLLQDCLPVKFQDVKFKDPNFKDEIFMRMDMKHSYFFIISD